MDEMYGQLHKC